MDIILNFIRTYNDFINLILAIVGIITLIFSIFGLKDSNKLLSKIIISEETNKFIEKNITNWYKSSIQDKLDSYEKKLEVKERRSTQDKYVASNQYSLVIGVTNKGEDLPEGKGNSLTKLTTIGIRLYSKEKWIHIIIEDKEERNNNFTSIKDIQKDINNESRIEVIPWNQTSNEYNKLDSKYTGILIDYSEVPFFYQNEIMNVTKKIIKKYFKIKAL